MKSIHDPGGEDDAYEVLDMGVVDPTSISLFSDEVPQYPSLSAVASQLSTSSAGSAVLPNRTATFASMHSTQTSRAAQPTAASSSTITTAATAAAATVAKEPKMAGERRKHTSYSTYMQGKSTEVAKRRRLNERVEKMKSSRGIIFNVPQCNEITTNQLAIFLRRLRKSADIRSMMSSQLIATIFQDEVLPRADPDADRRLAAITGGGAQRSETAASAEASSNASMGGQYGLSHSTANQSQHHYYHRQSSSSKHPAVISVSDILGEKDDSLPSSSHQRQVRQRVYGSTNLDEDDDTTESSSDSDECPLSDDGEQLSGSDERTAAEPLSNAERRERRWQRVTLDDYYFYKNRMEIISADLRAATYYRRCADLQAAASQALFFVEDFDFELAPSTGDEAVDSQTCARCRALTNQPSRSVFRYTHLEKRNRPATAVRSNLRCGVAEYASADDGIHPLLSLESAIPLDRKLQKYLHVSNMLAPEVERRRQKIAELASCKQSKTSPVKSTLFYSTDELQIPPEEENCKSPTSISLTLKKRLLKEASGGEPADTAPSIPAVTPVGRPRATRPRQQRVSSSITEDAEVDESPTGDEDESSIATYDDEEEEEAAAAEEVYRPRALSRRRATHGGQLSKRSLLESRRSSMHNIGRDESVFDFDSTFTDIGLTAIQNVETKEILIPQFVRKDVLDHECAKPCECCPVFTEADPFEKIRQMHEVLEAQERVRFRSLTAAARSRPSQAAQQQQQQQQKTVRPED